MLLPERLVTRSVNNQQTRQLQLLLDKLKRQSQMLYCPRFHHFSVGKNIKAATFRRYFSMIKLYFEVFMIICQCQNSNSKLITKCTSFNLSPGDGIEQFTYSHHWKCQISIFTSLKVDILQGALTLSQHIHSFSEYRPREEIPRLKKMI